MGVNTFMDFLPTTQAEFTQALIALVVALSDLRVAEAHELLLRHAPLPTFLVPCRAGER